MRVRIEPAVAWIVALLLALVFVTALLAQDKPVTLIMGLDGGDYEPYAAATVIKVQEALTAVGLYTGEISGKLDDETMQAIAEFQKREGLGVTGIPTPRTREKLFAERPAAPAEMPT